MNTLTVTINDTDRKTSWRSTYVHCDGCSESRRISCGPATEAIPFPIAPRGWRESTVRAGRGWTHTLWCPTCAAHHLGAEVERGYRGVDYPDDGYPSDGYRPLSRERVATWIGGPWAELRAQLSDGTVGSLADVGAL
jgi:hypothetical protein